MSKNISDTLNSYDFIKTFAVIVMVIDHVGYYLYPEQIEWRIVGRLCVPIWFFLIGYANSRNLDKTLWIGAIIVQLANVPFGNHVFPLNVLATMIAIRLVLDLVMERVLRSPRTLWSVSTIFFLLGMPTGMVTEYGTLGLILAMMGWFLRHRHDLKEPDKVVPQFVAFAIGSFMITEYISFGLTHDQFFVLILGMLLVVGTLYFFKPMTFPRLDSALPWLVKAPIKLFGRRTMEIYVVHLIVLKAVAMTMQPDRFHPFHITLFPVS